MLKHRERYVLEELVKGKLLCYSSIVTLACKEVDINTYLNLLFPRNSEPLVELYRNTGNKEMYKISPEGLKQLKGV